MKNLNSVVKKTVSALLLIMLNATISFTQPPTTIPGKIAYQGKLVENGTPVTGSRTIKFNIPGTGWMETHSNVSIAQGLYSVQLGSLTPIPSTVFSSPAVSLEITVEGTTLSPQVELLSVPYAYNAENLGGIAHVGNSANIGIGTTNPESSAVLEMNSSTQGFLMPRMDSAQIVGITDPASGLQVFNTTDEKVYIYVATENMWKELSYGSGTITVAVGTPNTVTDYDGNVYQTVQIGNQLWMAENLKTTHYANGDAIPNGTGAGDIEGETDPKYWFAYNDDLNNVTTYGRLYTWYTVADNRNVCPTGWHVPTDDEWKQLEMHLGMSQAQADATTWRGTDEGGKLKETGTAHWISPNTGATNESGFTALSGGYRHYNGLSYYGIGYGGYWWGATEDLATSAFYRGMYYNRSTVYSFYVNKVHGFSVRCVKN